MAPSIPMRQAARTPRRPYPFKPDGTVYAYAIEISQLENGRNLVKVRCPWCGHSHEHAERTGMETCLYTGYGYEVAVPEGTPIMVPVA